MRQQVVSGVAWTVVARVGQQLLQFTIMVVLARILTPDDFGLIGMVVVFTGFIALFGEAGFGEALVQHKDIFEEHRSSVFWLNIVLGLALAVGTAAIAPLVADFYDEPRLVPLTMLVGLNFLVTPLNVVQYALLRRALDFRRLAIIDSGSRAFSGAVAIALALSGYGVWSLAWQQLAFTMSRTSGMWAVRDWRPRRVFRWKEVRELLGFSSNLLGFRLVNYWVRNADNLLIGRYVSSAGLGIYTRAYSLMLLPVQQVTSAVSQVMFPALSRIQDDVPRIQRIYLRTNRVIGLVTIPMMLGLLIVAEPFVLTLYGPKWEAVVPILQLLCLVGIKQPLGSTTGVIYQSLGRTDIQFRWNLVSSAVTLAAFAIGIRWGVTGIAVAYVIRSYLVWYPGMAIPLRLIDVSFWRWLHNLSGVAGAAAVMGIAVYGVGLPLDGVGHAVRLAAQVAIGVAVYWVALNAFRVTAYRDLLQLIQEQIKKGRTREAAQEVAAEP